MDIITAVNIDVTIGSRNNIGILIEGILVALLMRQCWSEGYLSSSIRKFPLVNILIYDLVQNIYWNINSKGVLHEKASSKRF